MTIDNKINLGLRLLLCTDQEYGECCKGCPYGNGEESVAGCRTKLHQDIMEAMTTPAADDHSQKSAKDLISSILIDMGISVKNSGYPYLQEAIEYAVYTPAAVNLLTTVLYPHVGDTFGVSGVAAERNMRTSINRAIEQFGFEHVTQILRIPTQPRRNLSTAQVIATIADIVRREIGA